MKQLKTTKTVPMVFVVLKTGRTSPVAIYAKPCKPFYVPEHAEQLVWAPTEVYYHSQLVGKWKSGDVVWELMAYKLRPGNGEV